MLTKGSSSKVRNDTHAFKYLVATPHVFQSLCLRLSTCVRETSWLQGFHTLQLIDADFPRYCLEHSNGSFFSLHGTYRRSLETTGKISVRSSHPAIPTCSRPYATKLFAHIVPAVYDGMLPKNTIGILIRRGVKFHQQFCHVITWHITHSWSSVAAPSTWNAIGNITQMHAALSQRNCAHHPAGFQTPTLIPKLKNHGHIMASDVNKKIHCNVMYMYNYVLLQLA